MRKLTGFWDKVVKVLSFALIIFQLYTTWRGPYSDIIQRSIHLSFVLTLVFLLVIVKQFVPGLKLIALSMAVCVAMFALLGLANVEREAKDTTLKILGIGNSYTQDSMWMLGAIYKAEKNRDVILAKQRKKKKPAADGQDRQAD